MRLRQRYNYSEYKPVVITDKVGRAKRAHRNLTMLKDNLGDLKGHLCLDVGCSGGMMMDVYSDSFGRVVGCDVDITALNSAARNIHKGNVDFFLMDSMNMAFKPSIFDVVFCSQVYDSVADVRSLFDEIWRVLKRGGFCCFTGRNRFSLIDPSTGLLFINFLPRFLADIYVRVTGREEHFYERPLFLYGLRRLVQRFQLKDYTLKVIRYPQRFFLYAHYKDNSRPAILLSLLARALYPFLPNYIWLLKKR